jgi:hypothetical protein
MNLQSTSQKQTSTIPDDQGSGPDQISSTSNSNGSATQSATQTQQGPQAGSTIKPNKDPDIFADRRKQGGGY